MLLIKYFLYYRIVTKEDLCVVTKVVTMTVTQLTIMSIIYNHMPIFSNVILYYIILFNIINETCRIYKIQRNNHIAVFKYIIIVIMCNEQ